VRHADPLTNLTTHQIYVPKFEVDSNVGQSADDTATVAWVERSSGRCLLGGERVEAGYRLSETAEFIRPGSILPMVPTPSARWNADDYANTSAVCPSLHVDSASISNSNHLGTRKTVTKPLPAALLGAASRVPCTIEWHVYLGNATTGSGELLEDDGQSTKYMTAPSPSFIARTVANYTLDSTTDRSMLFELGGQSGNYSGSPLVRWVSVVVHNVLAPVSAKLLFPASGTDILNAVSW
jgi:hypothetical protein